MSKINQIVNRHKKIVKYTRETNSWLRVAEDFTVSIIITGISEYICGHPKSTLSSIDSAPMMRPYAPDILMMIKIALLLSVLFSLVNLLEDFFDMALHRHDFNKKTLEHNNPYKNK